MAVLALLKREVVIVQTSLIGSILSNLLLVLGVAFLAGGATRVEQNFNTTVAQTAASLLTVSCASLIVPTAFHLASSAGDAGITQLSRGTAVILLAVYASYLAFQLHTHVHLYEAVSEKTPHTNVWRHPSGAGADASAARTASTAPPMPPPTPPGSQTRPEAAGAGAVKKRGGTVPTRATAEPDGDPDPGAGAAKEEPELTFWFAIGVLVASTVLVAICAECLVSSIDHLVQSAGISRVFVGLILLPIVGNASGHNSPFSLYGWLADTDFDQNTRRP